MTWFLIWIVIGAVSGFALMYESASPGENIRLVSFLGAVIVGAFCGPGTLGVWLMFKFRDAFDWFLERYGNVVLFTKKGEKRIKTGVYEEKYDD